MPGLEARGAVFGDHEHRHRRVGGAGRVRGGHRVPGGESGAGGGSRRRRRRAGRAGARGRGVGPGRGATGREPSRRRGGRPRRGGRLTRRAGAEGEACAGHQHTDGGARGHENRVAQQGRGGGVDGRARAIGGAA
ncbi:MAG: hypothetical protein ACK559_08215, partial [bacterium]